MSYERPPGQLKLKFEKGKSYEYWTNFGGLNHIVKSDKDNVYPFEGPIESEHNLPKSHDRHWIYDYFYTVEELRDLKIDIINETSM